MIRHWPDKSYACLSLRTANPFPLESFCQHDSGQFPPAGEKPLVYYTWSYILTSNYTCAIIDDALYYLYCHACTHSYIHTVHAVNALKAAHAVHAVLESNISLRSLSATENPEQGRVKSFYILLNCKVFKTRQCSRSSLLENWVFCKGCMKARQVQ